jgi:regulator of sirC expression with transglutaminase-like and TPR domain
MMEIRETVAAIRGLSINELGVSRQRQPLDPASHRDQARDLLPLLRQSLMVTQGSSSLRCIST